MWSYLTHSGSFKSRQKSVYVWIWACVRVCSSRMSASVYVEGTASVGLRVAPQGAGAHVNEGSCWTGLLPPYPSSLPPLCPLVRWGCWQANLSSGDIKNPCEVSCCNFWPPPKKKPSLSFLIPLFLTCSSFDFLFTTKHNLLSSTCLCFNSAFHFKSLIIGNISPWAKCHLTSQKMYTPYCIKYTYYTFAASCFCTCVIRICC